MLSYVYGKRIETMPWNLHCRSPSSRTCRSAPDRLRIALSRSKLDEFWDLVVKGVDINSRDQHDKTPLHLVIYWKKKLAVVKAVLFAGADPNAIDCHGNSPLHAAIFSNSSSATIKALLNAGAKIEMPDSYGRSPLMRSIYQKNISAIKTLLRAGAYVKRKNLMVEAIKTKSSSEVIRLLINAGASVNGSSTAIPPISYAVLNGNLNVVKLLIAAGARLDFKHPKSGCTLLHQVKVAAIAHELIKHGIDMNAVNNKEENPLHTAVKNDRLDVAMVLIQAGANVHISVRRKWNNCLHLARSAPMVKMLASHGVDINARNSRGSTPLHALIRFCIYLSFPVLSRKIISIRAFQKTCSEKMNKGILAAKEMLKCGADVNAIDYNGATVLELAVALENPKIVFFMIKHGVDVCWRELFRSNTADKASLKLLVREYVIRNVNGGNFFDFKPGGVPVPRTKQELMRFAHLCKDEIDLMKVTKINCSYSVYHYVVEIAPKIKALRPCSHYDMNDNDCKAVFPIYKNKVSVRLNKCYRRAAMLDILEMIDVSVSTAEGKGVACLVNDCKLAVAEHLSNKDLFRFLQAMDMKTLKDNWNLCPKIMKCGEILSTSST